MRDTADKLIADKIGGKDWEGHLGQSESLFVNASAWGLMLTGKFVELGQGATPISAAISSAWCRARASRSSAMP